MIDLGFIDVSAAVVGSTYTIDWSKVRQEPTLKQMELGIYDHIAIYNESGCGFLVNFNQSNGSFTLPAGGWAPNVPVGLAGNPDLNCTLTVQYIIPGAGVAQVHSDYFLPGEISRANSVVLGNSPVNANVGVNLTTVVTAEVQITGFDNWTIQQDGSGNLLFTDVNTGEVYSLGRSGALTYIGSITITAPNSASRVVNAILPGVPGADQGTIATYVTGDTVAGRAQLYIRSADGYGGLRAGVGGAGGFTAQMYAQANGWALQQGLVSVAGQATVGSFGVPVAYAQAIRTVVTSTSPVTLFTIATPIAGTYRISGSIGVLNTATISLEVAYTDPDGGSVLAFLSGQNANTAAAVNLNGAAVGAGSVIWLTTVTFEVGTASSFSIGYTDSHAGPHSVPSIYLERLS